MLQAVKTPEDAAMSAGSEKEVPIQPVSLDIWDKKYRLKSKQGDHVDKDMDDSYQRVARALADVEEEGKRAECLKARANSAQRCSHAVWGQPSTQACEPGCAAFAETGPT